MPKNEVQPSFSDSIWGFSLSFKVDTFTLKLFMSPSSVVSGTDTLSSLAWSIGQACRQDNQSREAACRQAEDPTEKTSAVPAISLCVAPKGTKRSLRRLRGSRAMRSKRGSAALRAAHEIHCLFNSSLTPSVAFRVNPTWQTSSAAGCRPENPELVSRQRRADGCTEVSDVEVDTQWLEATCLLVSKTQAGSHLMFFFWF